MTNIITTPEEFKEAVVHYLAVQEIGPTKLGRRTGLSRGQVDKWIYRGLKSQKKINEAINRFPWIFDATIPLPQTGLAPAKVGTLNARTPESREEISPVLVLVKIEHARTGILGLSATLEWFLFEATAEERNQFRDALGKDWENLQWLTRAMTGETAFKIAIEEGRPKGED